MSHVRFVEWLQCDLLDSEKFCLILKEVDPQIIIYDRFLAEEQYAWKVRSLNKNICHVIDSQDLHFLREARQVAITEGCTLQEVILPPINLTPHGLVSREISAFIRSDHVFVCSPFEKSLLTCKYHFPEDKVFFFSYRFRFFFSESLSLFRECSFLTSHRGQDTFVSFLDP
eukprot:TRINITY_DN7964_c0_g1_i3.p1 TRINITY_DN7964_c0_g1~~TRINITY_DN7964_c0_g1_i3.p1  ORF type:complete len:171 (+),score=20.82 TRINITY_DN7964_c0_g1_i3:596-1108(+)